MHLLKGPLSGRCFWGVVTTLFFVHFLLVSSAAASPDAPDGGGKFTLNSADSPPYSTPAGTGLYDKILKRAFELSGINITINHLPSARSIENVDLGIDDGEFARIKGLTEKYPDIRIVEEKLIDFGFTAFARNPEIKITNWSSLQNFNVAYIRGWKIYEKNVTKYNSLQISTSEDGLFKLLLSDRVDIILYEQLRGLDYMKRHSITGIYPLKDPLSVRGMYLYLNKKHEAVIPRVEKALKQLKSNGEYHNILSTFM